MIRRKSWWQSMTVWLNALTAIAELANGIVPFLPDQKIHAWLIAGVGITNVVVRVFKTNTPIAAPSPRRKP